MSEEKNFLDRVADMVRAKCGAMSIQPTEKQGVFKGSFDACCFNCKQKKSRTCLLIVSHKGTVYYYSSCCKMRVEIGCTYTNELKFELQDGSYSPTPIGPKCKFLGTIDTEDCWHGVHVRDFDPSVARCESIDPSTKDMKCLNIQAGMGVGKTFAVEEFLKKYDSRYRRIVYPTSRRVMACSTLERFKKYGFKHYIYGDDVEQKDYGFVHVIDEILDDNFLSYDEKQHNLEQVLDRIQHTLNNLSIKKQQGSTEALEQTEQLKQYVETNMEALLSKNAEHISKLAGFNVAITTEYLISNVKGLMDDLRNLSRKQAEILTSDRLIIEYESLHKLSGKLPFDLVLLDETRSLVSSACCVETNQGARLAQNVALLRLIMKNAKLSLCLDANLSWDGACSHLVKSVFNNNEIYLQRYHHVALPRTVHATPNDSAFIAEIMNCVERACIDEKPIAICCRSRRRANDWKTDIMQANPGARVELFTGHSHESQITKFLNIGDFFAQKKPHVIIMTSVVTVGTDIQHQFQKVFVDFKTRSMAGASAQNVLQMIGRFRNVDDPTVELLYLKPPSYNPNLHADLTNLMHDRRTTFTKEYCAIIASITGKSPTTVDLSPTTQLEGCVQEDGTMTLKQTPNWYTSLFILEKVDQQQNQDFLFYANARKSGWRVILDAPESDEKAAKSKKKKSDAKKSDEDQGKRLEFEGLQKLTDNHTYEKMRDLACNAANASKHGVSASREKASIAHVVKHFLPLEPDDFTRREMRELKELEEETKKFEDECAKSNVLSKMTFDECKKVIENKQGIWNLAKWRCKEYTRMDQAEYFQSCNTIFFDITSKFDPIQHAEIERVLALLGVTPNPYNASGKPTNKLIPTSSFTTQHAEITRAMDKIARLRGTTSTEPRSKKPDARVNHARSRLNTVLKQLCGTTLTKKRGTNNIDVGYLYQPDKDCEKFVIEGNFIAILEQQHRKNEYKKKRSAETQRDATQHKYQKTHEVTLDTFTLPKDFRPVF